MILPTTILDPEFDAIWDLVSRCVPALQQIGRIVVLDDPEFVEAIDWAEVAAAMAHGAPL